MQKISLNEILDVLYLDELKEIANSFNLPQTGNKNEIIKNLIDKVKPYKDLLEAFKVEELKAICEDLRLPTGKKSDMIFQLTEIIDENLIGTGHIDKKPIKIEYLEPTIDNVLAKLKDLYLSKRKVKTEKDAEEEIGLYLSDFFRDVVSQYNLGGYLGLKIDLDIDNGKVGIEVKYADSFFKNTSEIFRLIGQGVYYQRKRYADNFVIAIAGAEEDLDDPVVREALSFLDSINIKCIGIPIK